MTSYLPVAIITAAISFLLFRLAAGRCTAAWAWTVLLTTSLALCAPAVLFLSYYVLKWPDAVWFINLHSLPGAEAASGLAGGLLGVVSRSRTGRRGPIPGLLTVARTFLLAVAVGFLVIVPFAKQMCFRLDYSKLTTRWKHGICLQTSGSTCVAASCATVVRMLGGSLSEADIARAAGSTQTGTEAWYAIRALRKLGYRAEMLEADSVNDIPAPAVLGVGIGAGHVVVLLSKDSVGPEIGDPLGSRHHYTWEKFERDYSPRRTFLAISSGAESR